MSSNQAFSLHHPCCNHVTPCVMLVYSCITSVSYTPKEGLFAMICLISRLKCKTFNPSLVAQFTGSYLQRSNRSLQLSSNQMFIPYLLKISGSSGAYLGLEITCKTISKSATSRLENMRVSYPNFV